MLTFGYCKQKRGKMKMKKTLLILWLTLFSSALWAGNNTITDSCTYKGIPLYGKVKIVTSFPNFKVKVVDAFPDLKVKVVTSFADDCGEWQFVESFPDFTIQLVDAFPDFTIKFVESFPGKK